MAANASMHNVCYPSRDDVGLKEGVTKRPVQVRSDRVTNMGPSAMNGNRSRASHNHNMAKGFGSGKSRWNNNIWGNTNLGTGFTDGPADTGLIRGTKFFPYLVLGLSSD